MAHDNRNQAGTAELKADDLVPAFPYEGDFDTSRARPRTFASLQLRAKNALRALLHSSNSRALVLCGSSLVDQVKTACTLVREQQGHTDNVVLAYAPTKFEFFGNDRENGIITDKGIVIMPISHLNIHPKWLTMLDAVLAQNRDIRLILCGDADDCAQLSVYWGNFFNQIQADLVLEFPSGDGFSLVASLVKSYVDEYRLKEFDGEAIHLLCIYLARISGDRNWLYIPEQKLISLCTEAFTYCRGRLIGRRHVLRAIAASDFRINFLAESELRDHRDRQILIQTSGSVTGQINGLSVIATAGTAYEYGQPVRITATLRAGGEGDVIDIERKAELAGQIHAKAMMIINGYLTKEFGSEQPLPVSASLVFEQSYSEIDGDSASLTGLCAVLSCLARLPIRQDLAVTGAVDQFGDVQAVGGVNEKIEGFFKVCKLHGLTGSQGVIIPSSCVSQLVLRPAVIEAVRKGRFHIYTAGHVTDAICLLTGVPFGEAEAKDSVCGRIVTNLSEIAENRPHQDLLFMNRVRNLLGLRS